MASIGRVVRPVYRVIRQDTFEQDLELVDADGEYITDTWGWQFTVRDAFPDTNVTSDAEQIEISKSGVFQNGTSTLTVSNTDMNIEPGTYYFDFQLTKPDMTTHSTHYGEFIVESDITRSLSP